MSQLGGGRGVSGRGVKLAPAGPGRTGPGWGNGPTYVKLASQIKSFVGLFLTLIFGKDLDLSLSIF